MEGEVSESTVAGPNRTSTFAPIWIIEIVRLEHESAA